MNSFPDLPVDVARYILEIAAVHDRNSSFQLVYISKAVREWIEPILYHTVVLRGRQAQDLFVQSCSYRLARDADFYARNLKVLCLWGITTYPLVRFILTRCTGVEALAVWTDTEEGMLPAAVKVIKARRLSVTLADTCLLECVTPNLTHLHLLHNTKIVNGLDWARLFRSCPHLTHILLDIVGEHVGDWNEELLGQGTVSKLRDILKAAPPSFKALIFEVLERDDGSPYKTSSEGRLEGGIFGRVGGFDVAAANLIEAISDKRFVFIIPNNRFTYVSGLVCYEYTHNPLLDWGYRVVGELDAFEMADLHLSTVGEYIF